MKTLGGGLGHCLRGAVGRGRRGRKGDGTDEADQNADLSWASGMGGDGDVHTGKKKIKNKTLSSYSATRSHTSPDVISRPAHCVSGEG